MFLFEPLLEKVRSYSPEADLELLRRAYVFSALEHKGQGRHSGEPYLGHPLRVAEFSPGMEIKHAGGGRGGAVSRSPARSCRLSRGHEIRRRGGGGWPAPRRRRGHADHP